MRRLAWSLRSESGLVMFGGRGGWGKLEFLDDEISYSSPCIAASKSSIQPFFYGVLRVCFGAKHIILPNAFDFCSLVILAPKHALPFSSLYLCKVTYFSFFYGFLDPKIYPTIKVCCPIALSSSFRTNSQNRVLEFPKFPMQWTNGGGEVSKLGGAHLHEKNLEALTWERQVPKIKNTFTNVTR